MFREKPQKSVSVDSGAIAKAIDCNLTVRTCDKVVAIAYILLWVLFVLVTVLYCEKEKYFLILKKFQNKIIS